MTCSPAGDDALAAVRESSHASHRPGPDGSPSSAEGTLTPAPESMLVDPTHILRSMRIWLTQKSSSSDHEGRDDSLTVEEASCGLWDLSANEECAAFMVGNQLLDLVTAVLGNAGSAPCRQVETACGIVANLICHAPLRANLEQHDDVLPTVVATMLTLDDVAVLIAACSALTSAVRATVRGRWTATMVSSDCAARLSWIVENSLDAELLERALELVGAVACMSEAGMSGLLNAGMLQNAMGHVLTYCTTLRADEPSSSVSARENVVDACLRVLEVVASHQDGIRLLEKHEERLKDSLLAILGGSESETLESSVVMVMAAWASPAILRGFLTEMGPFLKVFRILKAGEEEETQEAAWQLITAACATLPDVADLFPSAALPETADILSSLTHEPLPRERADTLRSFIEVLIASENCAGRQGSSELTAELQALRDHLN